MRNARLAFLVGLAIICAAAGAFAQQEPIRLADLKANFLMYHKEVVVVQGWVVNEKAVPQRSFKGFTLRDRYGELILIRTTKPLPGINTEIKIRGIALMDGKTPYIAEEERDELQKSESGQGPVSRTTLVGKGEPPVPPIEPGVEPIANAPHAGAPDTTAAAVSDPITATTTLPARQTSWLTWPWIAGLLVGAALLIGAFVLVLSRRKPAAEATSFGPSTADAYQNPYVATTGAGVADVLRPVGGAAVPAAAAPAEAPVIEDFKTVKAFKTSKVLPGKLVVVENGIDGDVIHLSDQSGRGEIEIGRDSPDATGGIRIKDRTNTLSRRQAKLMYSPASREFKLHNLVGDSGNPTVHNGHAMHENETIVLKDGDVLGMGSVELTFRQK